VCVVLRFETNLWGDDCEMVEFSCAVVLVLLVLLVWLVPLVLFVVLVAVNENVGAVETVQ